MKAQIVDKKSGSRRQTEDMQRIALDRPSVIFLKLAPEKVTRYERRGDDLVLILKDGQEIAIHGFFVKYANEDSAGQVQTEASDAATDGVPAAEEAGRNDLVLEDDNGVTWWGQYPDQWSEFHFTEIEWTDEGAVLWPWLLGALGGLGGLGGILVGGGGGKAHPPVAVDDRASGREDGGPIRGNVISNDSDPDGDALKVTQFTIDGKTYNAGDNATITGVGTFTLGSDGSYTFTPDANWNGTVPTVTYTISDGKGGTDTADLIITVEPVADLAAADDSNTTNEDTPVSGTVATNDSTTSGGSLTFVKASDPSHGTVVVNSDGTYTYTPAPNYNGPDSFTYTVTDPASGETLTQTVNITVDPVNDTPEANGTIGDQSNEDADGITTLDVTSYFSDVDGDALTYSATGLPAGLTIDPVTGVISGTIDRSASQDGVGGVHSVTVTVTDGNGASVDQTFTWTVTNPAPTANDDTATTDEDTAVSGNVISATSPGDVDDSDPDGDTLSVTTFTIAGDPTTYDAGDNVTIAGVGTFTLGSDGSYSFTPDVNWNGTVPTVTYTISDGEGGTDTADLVITVDPVNDTPEANGSIADQSNEDADGITTLDVTSYFSDVDGDALTYSATGLPAGLTIDPVTGVISGTIDRSASQDGTGGVHSVTITATDGSGASVDQTFTWTVTNPAPTANDDTATTDEDTAVSGNVISATSPGDVDDSDPDGDTLSVTTFTIAGDPTTYDAGDTATIAGVGTFTLGSDGSYTFTPDANWNGTVPTITYTISDGEGGTDTAELVITVDPVNDAPVIGEGAQTADVVEAGNLDNGTVIPGTPSATGSFTATDVDTGATQTWSVAGTPNTTYGTFAVDAAGNWTYTLNNGLAATQALNEGDTVPLTYTVRVTDEFGAFSEQTVTVTITGTNDAPVANADTGAVTESGVLNGGNTATSGIASAAGNVLTNDTDVDDGEKATLQVSEVSFGGSPGTLGSALTGTYGSLVLNANGTYTYTLANGDADTQALKQGATATEIFTYTAVDANGATSTNTLTITVTGTNDRPVIVEGPQTGGVVEAGNLGDGTVTPGTPSANGSFTATDVDTGATQTWSVAGTPDTTYGTFAVDATGNWTYTLNNGLAATQALNAGDTVPLTYTVRVTDEFGAFSEQTVTITITGSNDNLTGIESAAVVPLTEDGSATGTLQDYVSDVDDVIEVTGFTVDADGDGDQESFAPGAPVVLEDANGNQLGTLIIEANGDYSFTPAPNYSGDVPIVTYTLTETGGGSASVTQTIDFTITKISDAPTIGANKTVNTLEDTSVSLGLSAPVITDTGTGTGNNDHAECIGAITLTFGGAGAAGVTLTTGAITLTPVAGKVMIVITDEPHITTVPAENNANGVYYLTKAQYEALTANPVAESGKDFTVTVSATSYEVNATGAIIPGVAGATSSQTIDVDVQAVTDGATLTIGGATSATVTSDEDAVINLTGLMATLRDTDANPGTDSIDGSETYSYTVTGLPIGTVVTIDGVPTTITASVTSASSAVSSSATPPTITIKPPADFSGSITGVTITLNSKDTDADSSGTINTIPSAVTVDLHISPKAGDVTASNVTTPEDTAVAFLAGVTVTDTGTGTEVINSVSFTVPAGWAITAPTGMSGWSNTGSGSTYTITFDNGLTEAQREAILDAFTIKPPAHSSADVTINLSITTTDTNTVNGATVSDTQTVDRDVKITVTPVAERTDTDTDGVGGNDVTINPDHAYTTPGAEDSWFDLNIEAGFKLKNGWANADSDEELHAVLTPSLESDTPGDTVVGTQFRWSTDGGVTWQTATYTGDPIWVPSQYLDTLQVKLPSDVSGTLTIGVQAGTIDTDPDTGAKVTDISGSAELTLITFEPVADEVTMALNGRATGLEDTPIPLEIQTSSSDISETFNVTISGIPNGATIIYNGTELTVSGGSVTIADFSNSAPLTITPPLHSNDDFTLTVTAVSVDGTDTSNPVSRPIDVSVKGVADAAIIVTPAVAFSTTEAILEAGDHKVALTQVVTSVSSPDNDGSEVVTLRITGLPADFSITGATMVTTGTGTDRVWLIPTNNLANVSIVVPKNYSGTVNFKVAGVTTENDGDSFTEVLQDFSFTVTPSPEATITPSATLVEDEITLLNLAIIHQNGDTNEVLGNVYVPVAYDADTYTLYLGGTELSAAGLTITNIAGIDYYVIAPEQVGDLGAKGVSNLDGNLDPLNFRYDIRDPSNDGTLAPVTETKSGTLTLTATPVTDLVDASITAITMTTATGTTTDAIPADDATPDTATVTVSGSVTVNLHVDSADTDGSEHLVRVLITGVPDGVTVTGASQISGDTWLLIYEAGDAISIGAGGIDVPVEFVVGKGVGDGTSAIIMTAYSQDRGNATAPTTAIERDSVSWNLTVDLADGQPFVPPTIDEWSYNGAIGTEDTGFALGTVIDAAVATSDPANTYSYTVTITDLPPGSTVSGMTLTMINGQPVYSATVTVLPGGDSQLALDGLLAGITITPPGNSNDNNAGFAFDAKLTATAVGGSGVEADTSANMPVTPVTDQATVTVTTNDVDEGQTSVTATISAEDITDGSFGTIVDGKLYVQIAAPGNGGGTVTDDTGQTLVLTPVSGVAGVPDGNYYVIDVGITGGSVDLTYTTADGTVLAPGDVTFTAWAQTQETGAGNIATGSSSGTAEIIIVNNGVTGGSQAVTGSEPVSSDKSHAIELVGLSVALTDNDGSESIQAILLSGVPVGFLLYVGDSAGNATLAGQASNAGGDGTTNTWLLSTDGTMPAYVAILPPKNWSGTLPDLSLIVASGEDSLDTIRLDTVPLETVTVEAVANGVTIDPTLSFGIEGRIIPLNLNASMADAAAAASAVPDASTETTTLQIKGLGEYAAFYADGTLVSGVNYDKASDTYTITGLSQSMLDKLGFVQATAALTDQDGAAGMQVTVTAWTVESANGDASAPVTDTLTLAMVPVFETTGNDNFIWDNTTINGKGGIDTVALRLGEDVSHSQLASLLRNVEVIDLSVAGENNITGGLSISDVLTITGSSSGTLTIKGDSTDTIELSSASEWSTNGVVTGGYVTYTSTSGVTLLIDDDIYNNNHVSYAA